MNKLIFVTFIFLINSAWAITPTISPQVTEEIKKMTEASAAAEKAVAKYVSDAAQNDGETVVQIFTDMRYRCVRTDLSLDFNDCRDTVNAYNASYLSEKAVLEPGIAISQVSAQNQATQQVTQNPLNPTAGLNAVGGVVENQQTNETIKASFYGANAVMISGFMAAWKTPQWLSKKDNSDGEARGCKDSELSAHCETLAKRIAAEPSYAQKLFPNRNVKNFFTQELVRYSGQSAMHGVLAGQYAKQKKLINDANQDLKEFQDEIQDLPTIEACAENSTLPGCSNSNRTSYGAVGQGNFTIGGNANTTGFNPNALDETGGNNPDKLSAGQQEALASGLANLAGNPSSSAKDVAPGAGFYEAGGGGAGGGGAIGGGGASGGGGQGRLSDTPGEQDNQAQEVTGMKIGKTDISYSSGKGLANSKSTNREYKDPFGGLFGGDKKKTGGIEVDRSLASDIDGGNSLLFEKISKRYSKVIDEKRLLEVELEK